MPTSGFKDVMAILTGHIKFAGNRKKKIKDEQALECRRRRRMQAEMENLLPSKFHLALHFIWHFQHCQPRSTHSELENREKDEWKFT